MNDYLALEKMEFSKFKIFKKGLKLEKELIKYTDIDSVKVIELPEEVYEDVDKTKFEDNQVYKNTLNMFGKKIRRIVPEEDLNNFYRNFSTIKMIDLKMTKSFSRLLTMGGLVGGLYNPEENIIACKDSILSTAIGSFTHELLHASSCYYDEKRHIVYCGLSQIYINTENRKKSETYGLALNEGYTQYLNNKYFVDQDSVTFNLFGKSYKFEAENTFTKNAVYKEEQIIAKALNAIFGEEKMSSFYFRGDLNGLVKELEKYQSKEAIYRFINYTDTLCLYAKDKQVPNEIINEVKSFVNSFLLRTFDRVKKAEGVDYEEARIYFFENCFPYRNPENDSIVLSDKYLSGKEKNPIECLTYRKK